MTDHGITAPTRRPAFPGVVLMFIIGAIVGLFEALGPMLVRMWVGFAYGFGGVIGVLLGLAALAMIAPTK